MATFSKEYQQKYYPGMAWDFSIQNEFAKLEENQQKYLCCEAWALMEFEKTAVNFY